MSRSFFASLASLPLLAVVFAAPVAAQEEEADSRFYDFSDMVIDGALRRPEGELGTARGRASFGSLLRMERTFIPEVHAATKEQALE
jgi:hypothetical protein